MFKFSQLVTRAYKPIKLKKLLVTQKCCHNHPALQTQPGKRSNLLKSKAKHRPISHLDRVNISNSSQRDKVHLMQRDVSINSQVDKESSPSICRQVENAPTPGVKAQMDRNFEALYSHEENSSYMRSSASTGGETFTFVSFNILAQDLLECHPNLYRYHDPLHLNWKFRLNRLSKEILSMRPDILCLQEVQHDHLPEILKSLEKLNFDFVFKKKTGNKTDGCAILFNKNMFDLIEKHTVEFYQPNITPLDRENVALIAKFCFKSNPSSCFITSTTHLLYNPRRQDVRLAQIQLLLAELDHISFKGFDNNGKPRRNPIILSGDFNLLPYSAPYNLLTLGSLTYHNLTQRTLTPYDGPDKCDLLCVGRTFLPTCLGITDHCQHIDVVKKNYKGKARIQNTDKKRLLNENCVNTNLDEGFHNEHQSLFSTGELKHFLNLESVYDHTKNEVSTFQDGWITVDYIFYSQFFSPSVKSITDGYLKVLSRYTLPTASQCYGKGLVIPNYHYGSDHLLLAAKFFLQFPRGSNQEETEEK